MNSLHLALLIVASDITFVNFIPHGLGVYWILWIGGLLVKSFSSNGRERFSYLLQLRQVLMLWFCITGKPFWNLFHLQAMRDQKVRFRLLLWATEWLAKFFHKVSHFVCITKNCFMSVQQRIWVLTLRTVWIDFGRGSCNTLLECSWTVVNMLNLFVIGCLKTLRKRVPSWWVSFALKYLVIIISFVCQLHIMWIIQTLFLTNTTPGMLLQYRMLKNLPSWHMILCKLDRNQESVNLPQSEIQEHNECISFLPVTVWAVLWTSQVRETARNIDGAVRELPDANLVSAFYLKLLYKAMARLSRHLSWKNCQHSSNFSYEPWSEARSKSTAKSTVNHKTPHIRDLWSIVLQWVLSTLYNETQIVKSPLLNSIINSCTSVSKICIYLLQTPEDLWANHSKFVSPKPHMGNSPEWKAIMQVPICWLNLVTALS